MSDIETNSKENVITNRLIAVKHKLATDQGQRSYIPYCLLFPCVFTCLLPELLQSIQWDPWMCLQSNSFGGISLKTTNLNHTVVRSSQGVAKVVRINPP